MAILHGESARADPSQGDGGSETTSQPVRFAEVLHATTAISRMNMRCRSVAEGKPREQALAQLRCTFFTLALRQHPPEKMATLENFAEILREIRAQCRSGRPRSEQTRKACATCRGELSDECLYVEKMKELRKDCATPRRVATHANPAIAARG